MSIRTIPLVAVAAVAMALAAPAVAKEIETTTVCGADGCKDVEVNGNAHALLDGGPSGADAAEPAPFFRIRLGIGDGSGKIFERFTILYVPSAEKVRGMDGVWMNAPTAAVRALERVTRGREPIPARRLKATPSEETQIAGTSLPPEIVGPPDDGSGGGGGGLPSALIVIAAGGGVVLLTVARWTRGRRPRGGGRSAVAP
jgi:hypothetical protein